MKVNLRSPEDGQVVQNVEVKNMDAQFPTPVGGGKALKAQALKSGVKSTTSYKRVVEMMATRVQRTQEEVTEV